MDCFLSDNSVPHALLLALLPNSHVTRERLEVISAEQQGEYEQLTVNLYSYERACRDFWI